MGGISFTTLTAEAVGRRLRAMDDQQLKQFGKSAAYMCSPEARYGGPPSESYVLQLREARAEWARRRAVEALAK